MGVGMIKADLIEKSPVRKLEVALSGGLKAGEFGVITSAKGGGKTSMLVQLGIDELLRGNRVFHISFSQDSDYAITWYSNLFDELAKHKNLESAAEIKSTIMSSRVILNFNQDSVTTSQVVKTVKTLSEGVNAKPHALMIDDFDFTKTTKESLMELKSAASEMGLSVWFTAKMDVQNDTPNWLEPFADMLDVVLLLKHSAGTEVGITALTEHGNKNVSVDVRFDTKSLLLL